MAQTLAQLVRAKYPGQYDDLSDADLEAKVRAKFPGVYDDLASSGPRTEKPNEALSQLKDVGIGALKGAGASVGNIGQMILESGMVPGMATGLPNPLLQKAQQYTTATNTPQMIGKGLETAAELAVPSYEAGKAALTAARAAPTMVGDIASHVPIIGPYVRMARTLGKYLPDAAIEAAPEAAADMPIMTPTRMVGAKMAGTPSGGNFSLSVPSPSGMASLEAAAPTAVDRPVGQPSPNAFVPVKSINPADMPRSWHAFLDPEARAAADPTELEQAGGLHRWIAEADKGYKAATMGERATFQNMSPETKNILLGLLTKVAGGS